ncbi:RapH N-terminal domain-containing protein [Veillonella sp. 3627]|uniref:MuF-C-terminal domain-containing protein n=1 Tax=Veillonella sp. 3627 TaxID=2490953 RepID=UPI000F8E604F|nr:RapH N-terminal domain-containing protein [Veillonella sp. 3627]
MTENKRITAEDVRKGGFIIYDNPKYVKDFVHVDDEKERNMSFGDRLDSLFENSNSTLSKAYRKIAYNDADWSQDAIEIGKTLDISPNVLINGGHDVIERAREMSIRKNTLNDMEAFKAEYPEFSNIQYSSEAEAIELLKNTENVRQTRGIWDSIQQGIWSGNDQLLLAKQGRDLAYETDPNKIVEINHEIERLQNNLSQYRTEGSNWIESIAGATAQQGVIMGRQIASAAMIEGTAGATLGATAGAMAGGAGAIPGAISGFGLGFRLGLGSEIQKMSFGQKYLDLMDKKDANGNQIYSNEEAKIRASVFSLPDAAIEMVGLGLAVKSIKAVKPGVSVLTKMIENQSKTAIMKEGAITTAKESFKAGLKSGASELLEEGLQDINDKVQTNLWGKQGDVHYSLADIGIGSINAMIDAVPAVVGLGVLGGLGGTAHTIHQFRAFHRLSPEQQDMVVQSDINQRGNQVVSALIKESQVNPLAKKNPELFAKTIQATADKQGIGTVYINAHELVDTQQGQEAIQSLINSGIVTREEATKAIEHEAALPVPISQFAQLNTEITEDTVKALEKATFYTEGGMSVASIEQAVKGAKAYQEHFAGEHAKKMEAVKEDIMKEFSNHSDRERTLAEMVVSSDPYHIKQAFNDMYNQMEETYRETYHDEHKALEYDKEGPKPKWYDDHVAMHHRAPSYKDRRRIAFEHGKKQLSQEYADVISDSAMETAMNRYKEMEEALQDLEAMDSIKDTLFKIADSDVHVRSNLSDEGYQIYKDLVGELKKGNPAVASQAKEGALVMAMHADVMANIMKKAGYGHFTAKDYMERIQIEANAREVAGSGYAQPINNDVDVDTPIRIIDVTPLFNKNNLNLDKKSIIEQLKNTFKEGKLSADNKAVLGIPNSLKRRHLVWNQIKGNQMKKAFDISLLTLDELVKSSVLIESIKNQKKDKNIEKGKVENYHYFYVPMRVGNYVYTMKIVGEEQQNEITLNPTKIDLYSIIPTKKESTPHLHDGKINGASSLFNTFTIRDMLKDVKDYEGNNYIDEEGNPNYYAQKADDTMGALKDSRPEWEVRLEQDSIAWNSVMDHYKDGEIQNRDVRLMSTPIVLQMLGFSAHDIEITPSVLAKVLKGKHADSIDTEVLKDLPRAIANPVAIFRNYDGEKREYIDNQVIVVVDIADKQGEIIQIPLVFDVEKRKITVNRIKSIFGRGTLSWYSNSLKYHSLLYYGKKKTNLSGNGASYAPTRTSWSIYDSSIQQDTENSKGNFEEDVQKKTNLSGNGARRAPTRTSWSNIALIIEQHLQKSNEKVLTSEDLDKARAAQQNRYYQAEESSKYRGLTTVYPEELGSKRLIQLFDAANFSTFIHESGHLFLEDLRMLATMDDAPKQVVEDWNTIKEWSGWSDTESANNTAAHEKFATGFEAYIREGKAPTKVLERIFRRFKEWLSALYKSVTLLGGLPPKEVQDVMARMLATEEDINSYITQQGLDSFERTGLYQSFTEEKQVEWQEKLDRIREKAKEKVLTTYMKELSNTKLEEFEASIPELEEMLQRQLVEQYPVYQARVRFDAFGVAGLEGTPYHSEQALIDGELNDGIGSMKEVVAKEIQSKREEVERFTHDYEAVKKIAEEYLLTTEGMQRITAYEAEAIRKDTNKAVAKHFELISALGDIDVNDPSSIERVASAIKDDKVQKKVWKLQGRDSAQQSQEIKKLQEELQTGISNMRALRGLSLWSTEDMMEKAHNALRTMTIPQATSFKTYQNKSASSARKADIAISKGQMDEAFHHKQQQLYYQAMARAAYDNLREVETLERDLKKKYQSISRPKSPKRIHSSARYFIQHMMYQLNLVNRDGIEPSKGFNIGDVLLLLDPDAEFQDKAETKMTLDPWIMELLEKPKSWKQLTFDQLLDMGQLLKAVYTQGAQQYEGVSILNEQGESISFEDAGAELIIEGSKRLQSNTKDLLTQANQQGFFGRLQDTFSGYMLSLVKVETILRRYDDDKAGVWNRYIYEPINRATVKGKEMLEDATRNLQQVMKVYGKKELFHIRTERMYNIGTVYSMTKEQVLALALNWGTKNNRQRVIETVGLSDQEEAEVLIDKAFSEFLDAKDWDFVEKTWELINSYYAERSAVQERLYGSPMHKERGVTFTINGRKIRGQYYPIVYDPTVDGAAKDYEVEDIIKSQMSSSAVWGMGMSATKSRVQLVKGKKLLLSFDVIPRAIDEAINHISMREAATDVNRLLNNRALSDYIVRTTGVETLQMLKTWVRDNWQSEISKSSRLDRVLQDLRRNTSMAIMSYRTSTALLNVLNVIPMTKEIGLLNTIRALTEFMGYPLSDRYVSNRKFVMERSIFLRERIHTLDHDLHEGLSIGGKGMTFFPNSDIGRRISETKHMTKEVRDTISRYGYVFITETDLMLSMPLWKFAYEQKVAELLPKGLDQEYIEAEAISAADRQVRRVFGSGDTKDSVELQRKKNSLVALFTPFYTYANTVLNALVEGGYAAVDKQDYMKLFNHILFWVVLQNMSEALLRSTWSGDDDDAESLLKKMLSSVVTGSFVGFPILRDGVSLAMDMAMGKPSMSKGNETVALSLMPKLLELYRNVKSSKKSWIDVMRSTSQVSNRLTGFSDTFTDGFWTLAKWSFSNTEATLRDLITAIAFDKNLRSREEKRK